MVIQAVIIIITIIIRLNIDVLDPVRHSQTPLFDTFEAKIDQIHSRNHSSKILENLDFSHI